MEASPREIFETATLKHFLEWKAREVHLWLLIDQRIVSLDVFNQNVCRSAAIVEASNLDFTMPLTL